MEPGEVREHAQQALAVLQPNRLECGHSPYQDTPPPNPHQTAAPRAGVIRRSAFQLMESSGPHRVPTEEFLEEIQELCALLKEDSRIFFGMPWARKWAHVQEDLSARAEELCEEILRTTQQEA